MLVEARTYVFTCVLSTVLFGSTFFFLTEMTLYLESPFFIFCILFLHILHFLHHLEVL